MIPKVIKNKRQLSGKAGIKKLVDYVTEKSSQKLNEVISENSLSHNDAEKLTDYITRNNSKFKELPPLFNDTYLLDVDGISVMHNLNCDLKEAANIMAGTAINAKCDKPMMHYVLSWKHDETPSDKDIFSSALFTLKALGLQDHEYVCAVHNDTDNIHVHVAVNRVHPVTLRVNRCSYSQEILHKSCRILELKHGFKHDNGSFIVNENGVIVRNKDHHKNSLPENAYKMEFYSGKQSVIDYLNNEPTNDCFGRQTTVINALSEDIRQSYKWQHIHDAFAKAGLSLVPSQHVGGLLVECNSNTDTVKVAWSRIFSDKNMSFQALSERLGTFYPNNNFHPVPLKYGMGYAPQLLLRERDIREEMRTKRLEKRVLLRGRYEQYKTALPVYSSDGKQRISDLNHRMRLVKAEIRKQFSDPVIRKQFYNACEFDRFKSMSKIRLELTQKRNGFYAKHPRLTYQQWVEKEALNGDPAALSQLRGWQYKQNRKHTQVISLMGLLNEPETSQPNYIRCEDRADVKPVVSKAFNLEPELLKSGVVVYRDIDTKEPLILDRGHIIVCRNDADSRTLKAVTALSLTEGETTSVQIFGTPSFKEKQAELFKLYKTENKAYSSLQVVEHRDSKVANKPRNEAINNQLYTDSKDSQVKDKKNQFYDFKTMKP